MKYFLIAGEASGDFHASNLMRAIRKYDPEAAFRFMGGDLMAAEGGEMVRHYRDTSYMLLDVVIHLPRILKNMGELKNEIREWNPDVLIPVDYPGFNLRMARFASKRGIRVHYYISPKVWAWRQGRAEWLRQYTDRLFVIFPFEEEFYRRLGIEVTYEGNPLVDSVGEFLETFPGPETWKRSQGLGGTRVVALLPGSRKREIEALLPVMLQAALRRDDHRFVVAGAPAIGRDLYDRILGDSGVKVVYGKTYELLASSSAALVASGTATLEAAMFLVPQVVVYRTGPLAYAIGKRLINVNFISLVNLILERELVKELIQSDLKDRSCQELQRILDVPDHRGRILAGYRELASMLGSPGVTDRVARKMVAEIKKEKLKAD